MVAHAPDYLCLDPLGERLDHLAQLPVCLRLAAVGQVTGEHQCLGRRVQPPQPVEGDLEVLHRVHHAVLQLAAGKQVGVADVRDGVAGVRVLAKGLHGRSVEPARPAG